MADTVNCLYRRCFVDASKSFQLSTEEHYSKLVPLFLDRFSQTREALSIFTSDFQPLYDTQSSY